MNHSEYKRQLENDAEYQSGLDEMRDQFALGDAIIKARIQRGLSQSELAEMVGTKQANISRLEAGIGNPTLKLISKVIKALGIRMGFELPLSSNSYKSIPTPRIPAPNWPTRPTWANSTSSQTEGKLR